MLINFIIIGTYDGNDSLNISLYKLYRNLSDSKLYIPNSYSFYDNENVNKREFLRLLNVDDFFLQY